jgi:catechol 2,3-dioxygenase-like lactoylglutathione lyase family enzyme
MASDLIANAIAAETIATDTVGSTAVDAEGFSRSMPDMISGLDHTVILVRDIEAGVAGYQALFGCAPAWRAQKDGVATAIFSLANTSLELMAPATKGEGADRVRSVLDAQGEGVASIAFAVDDIDAARHRLARLGLLPSDVSDGESSDLGSGRTMTWKRIRTASEVTGGVRLFFLQRIERFAPSPLTEDAPIDALDHIVLATPDPERAAALYGARLGLDMRLDRTVAALQTRFLFFRTGGVVFEIIHSLKSGWGDDPDTFFGLSWRAADLEATRARLQRSGFDVSDSREGRKPGSRVFTVRKGTFGVPTLVIQQGAQAE